MALLFYVVLVRSPRFEMFFKSLFKSIHIVEILVDRNKEAKTGPGMAQVRNSRASPPSAE